MNTGDQKYIDEFEITSKLGAYEMKILNIKKIYNYNGFVTQLILNYMKTVKIMTNFIAKFSMIK